MRLLRAGLLPLLALGAIVAVIAGTHPATAHPENEPGNGVDAETACTLWAADVDETNATEVETDPSTDTPELCLLAPYTDIPLDSPPVAVEHWNRGDHRNFPTTGARQSVYPPHASRTNGRFLKDAYVEVFAVQPSTKAYLTPSEQPLYVASEGHVLGTVDYRAAVPDGESSERRRIDWSIVDHTIDETRLLVDGRIHASTTSTHSPSLSYSLAESSGWNHDLTLEANVTVEMRKETEVCDNYSVDRCTEWDSRVAFRTETVTVRDTVDVVEYDLTVTGLHATYPNGDLGLRVSMSHPWLGHTVPDGEVRGVWRFFVARDTNWDDLVTATAEGETTSHSPMHPLSVNAFPIETRSSSTPHQTVRILDELGPSIEPATLPDNVNLDVVTEPYVASYGLATRTATADHDLDGLVAHGLVRGVDAEFNPEWFGETPIHRSNLTLSIRNRTDENVTVELILREEAGPPIATADREGYVLLRGTRLETNANGSAVATVPIREGGVSARYVPAQWWREPPGYVGDSDVVYVGGGISRALRIIFEFAVPASLFFLAAFIVDRFTGWRVWPPWRRV